ncbi:hypothetical protein DC852_22280 [Vibrio parahaemolyticus]|nr:hypothetical protein [Vibrio parahaemolyticus]EGR3244698.1 hypothetical protein [Vibrio parahaemolyticus]EGR3505927.1 hypothetical protein [Vibrio parahaemolyticus]EGR3511795.1 hypothetical protein [Vibrio parahaemolyticus]OUJ27077.1 hypothetical protein BTR13_23765 [Vibrio parahaemolyticus]
MPIKGASHITKHLRGIHNAWRFWFESALVLTAQWFRSGGGVVHPLMRRYVFKRKLCLHWKLKTVWSWLWLNRNLLLYT